MVSASTDYRAATQRKLPSFLSHYIDGGTYAEYTLCHNVEDLSAIALRQRMLENMSELSLEIRLSDETLAMSVTLAPVGLTGMYARRDEVQTARVAAAKGIPFALSMVSVYPIEEITPAIDRPMWLQLHVLKDHGFMRNVLEWAKVAGVTTLVFTIDMLVPDARYHNTCSGVSGSRAAPRRILQAMTHPVWAQDIDLLDKPHGLGNISAHRGNPTGLKDYIGWLGANFDPSISWKSLEWVREFWDGPMVVKGILGPENARDVVKFSADGIAVPNHGGRQLDDVPSSARALPAIVDAMKGELVVLTDSGVCTGLDVVRMIALGADSVLPGRAFVYTLVAAGEAGTRNLLELVEKEMRVAMVLTGAKSIGEISANPLVRELGA